MDPLSVLAGLAGVASAGASLSNALFNIVSTIRSAPEEMAEIARVVSDLSVVLRELRRVLKKGENLHRSRLLRQVRSVIYRIEDIHEEVRVTINDEAQLARLRWVFRKSRATSLLRRIESHKTTVSLMTTTMLLAMEQRKQSRKRRSNARNSRYGDGDDDDDDDDSRSYRQQAENLIMATHQSLGDLSRATPIESVPSDDHPSAHLVPEKISSQRETQNNRAGKLISSSSSTLATQASASNTVKAGDNSSPNTQLQHRREDSMDTATWLYYLVFSEGQMPAVTRDSALTAEKQAIILAESKSRLHTVSESVIKPSKILDRLLLDWTRLKEEEIDANAALPSLPNEMREDWFPGIQNKLQHLPTQPEYMLPSESTHLRAKKVDGHKQMPERGVITLLPRCRATEADARHHGIQRGSDLSHWDPTLKPLAFLGKIYDMNSVICLIYVWAVGREEFVGRQPTSLEVIDDRFTSLEMLWLKLIPVSEKLTRLKERLADIDGAGSTQPELSQLAIIISKWNNVLNTVHECVLECAIHVEGHEYQDGGEKLYPGRCIESFLGAWFNPRNQTRLMDELGSFHREFPGLDVASGNESTELRYYRFAVKMAYQRLKFYESYQ